MRESEHETGDPALLRCFKGLFNAKAFSISDIPRRHLGQPGTLANAVTEPPRQFSRTGFKLKGAHSSTAQRKECGFRRQIKDRILQTLQVITPSSVSSNESGDNSTSVKTDQGAAPAQSQDSVWFS